jgi:hypothetical protein
MKRNSSTNYKTTFQQTQELLRKGEKDSRRNKLKELYRMESEKNEYELYIRKITSKQYETGKNNFKDEIENTLQFKERASSGLVNKHNQNYQNTSTSLKNTAKLIMKNNINTSENTGQRLSNPQNKDLNNIYDKYSSQIDNLKYVDFISRKRIQDELLKNINFQMEKLKYGLNTKSYEEKIAEEYYSSYKNQN